MAADTLGRLSTVPGALAPGDSQELLEAYLDCLIAPTVGILPPGERLKLRHETAFHLEYVARSHEIAEIEPVAAMRKAIREYGRSDDMAARACLSWYERQARSVLAKRFGRGNLTAFVWFGIAQAVYIAILQFRVFLPSGEAYSLPLTPAQARHIVPDPLPVPLQMNAASLLLYLYPAVVPIIAGGVVGCLVPVGAARSVVAAMLPIILYSFVLGTLFLPNTAGVVFALAQIVWWLPVGPLVAHVASILARQRRLRYREAA